MPEPDNTRLPDGLLEQPSRSQLGTYRRHRRRRSAVLAVVALAAVTALAAAVVLGSGCVRGVGEAARPTPASTLPSATPKTAPAGATTATTSADATASSQTATSSAESTPVVEIGWVGDLTPGSKFGNPPRDGRSLFKYTRDYLTEPDVMVANLEGTFGTGGRSKCDDPDSKDCFVFQAPPANAESLSWAGIDVVNLANNHTYDYLAKGLRSTRQALEENDLDYTGLVDTVAIKEVNGVRIAFLGFAPYRWSPDLRDLEAAKKLVRAAGKDADIVVVLMHAGAEGADKATTPQGAERAYGESRGDSRGVLARGDRRRRRSCARFGPHVVRGMEEYEGRLIAYSLGNFAGWNNFNTSGRLALSGLLTVRLAEDGRVLGGKWQSLKITGPGVPKPDSKNASAKLVRRLSEKDFETPVKLDVDGSFTLEGE